MTDALDDRVQFGLAMAAEAGEMSRRYFQAQELAVDTKVDGTPVTDADRDIELFMRDAVGRRFADDAFTGEEYAEQPGDSGFRWIVDPIDGTKSFVRGVPLYANLIALQRDGEVVFGVINLPSAAIVVHAEKGKGCWRNGTRVQVSQRCDLDGAHVMATWLEDWDTSVISELHSRNVVLRTWGDAFGYAMVACGYADAVVDYTACAFDLAPMPVILAEAGGRFTSLDGREVFDAGNGVASNGHIHDELVPCVAPA